MAAHVFENQNDKSSLHINNQVPNMYPISIFDRAKSLIAIVFTQSFKGLVSCGRTYLKLIESLCKILLLDYTKKQ